MDYILFALKALAVFHIALTIYSAIWVYRYDLPQWLDRATAYGDGKLNIGERYAVLVLLPTFVVYVVYHEKWPGLVNYWPELWSTIVLGRQYSPEVK